METILYLNQDYKQIKKKLNGKLFEDPEFPANGKSIIHFDKPADEDLMRPSDLNEVGIIESKPIFRVKNDSSDTADLSPNDVFQGKIGILIKNFY